MILATGGARQQKFTDFVVVTGRGFGTMLSMSFCSCRDALAIYEKFLFIASRSPLFTLHPPLQNYEGDLT